MKQAHLVSSPSVTRERWISDGGGQDEPSNEVVQLGFRCKDLSGQLCQGAAAAGLPTTAKALPNRLTHALHHALREGIKDTLFLSIGAEFRCLLNLPL